MKRISRAAAVWAAALALVASWQGPAVATTAAAPTAAAPTASLVIDPGFHTAPVRRLALSADERFVATASDDKTVAIWRTDTGERVHLLRGRPGPGAQGRMYGVAFHPRRDLLAFGGSGAEGGPATIYLHSASDGAFVRAIDAGRGEIKRLVWSADGRWLLAAFAAPGAVRVFDADGRRTFELPLAGDGYGLDVHASQRVAATDTRGVLHLHSLDDEGRLTEQGRVALGGTPVAVAFAPRGDRLAVVHFDLARHGLATLVDVQRAVVVATWRSPQLASDGGAGGGQGGRLQSVAWSKEGDRLAIGGVVSPVGAGGRRAALDTVRGVIQEFDATSGTAQRLLDVAIDAVTDLRSLAGGRYAFASFDGSWGAAGAAPAAALASAAPLGANVVAPRHDVVRRPDRLWLAPGVARAFDGLIGPPVVQWQGTRAAAPRHFDFAARVVRAGAAHQAAAPDEPGPSSGTRDWDSVPNANVMLLGGAMALDAGEISRAAARLPRSADLIWGTGHRLARVSQDGRIVWSYRPGTETRAVHASPDGSVVVAAMSDGTLRWHRARDGALLLSLFVLDAQRWVMWSPAGFYDASAGAEPLLGWLVAGELLPGGGVGEGASYVSIGRFRQRYHRPDVIDRLLVEQDEAAALQRADQAREAQLRADQAREAHLRADQAREAQLRAEAERVLPGGTASRIEPLPAIPASALPAAAVASSLPALAAPLPAALPPVLVYKQAPSVQTSEARVTLNVGLRLPGNQPLVSLVVRRDGVLQEDAEVEVPPTLDGASPVRVKVAVPTGDSLVHVSAANANGFSDALAFKVSRLEAPAATPRPDAADDRPRLFALVIGVGRYADAQISPLDLPAKDADDFGRVLAGQAGRAYRSVQTRVLTDEQATRASIVSGLEWLARSVGPRDFGMLFMAGHALNHDNGSYYFLGHDTVVDKLTATAVAQAQIRSTLARLKGRAVLFVDTCHAGNVFGTGTRTGPALASRELARLANELASPENGVIVFASSTGRQLSLESREWGNGAFTRALVAGLSGSADLMRRGRVTFQGLGFYVSSEVERLTRGQQTPVVIAPPPGLPDFTLALLTNERLALAALALPFGTR